MGELSYAMAALGEQPVVVLAPNSHVLLEAHFGVPWAGVPLVAINTPLAAEVAYLVAHCEAAVLIYDVGFESTARADTAAAARHVCLRKFEPGRAWRLIEQEKVTHFEAAPTVLSMLAAAPEAVRRRSGPPVRICTGGAPPSPTLLERMSALGAEVTHLYGLIETFGPAVVCQWRPDVTLHHGKTASERDIIDHVRDRLARFKAPRRVVFSELPKSSTGKIQKFVLRERARHDHNGTNA